MNIHQLAPDEPLSPELVLVFSPELRAQALARLGAPVWTTPLRRAVESPAPDVGEALAPSLGGLFAARVGQLALVFVLVTTLVLAMSFVAHATR
jgi:hypothetical protein